MRKTQIVSWLERLEEKKQNECLKAYYDEHNKLVNKIYEENGTNDTARIIHEHIVAIGKQVDKWKKGLDERVVTTCYYDSLERFSTELSTYESVYQRLTHNDSYVLSDGEVGKLKRKKDKTIEEISRAYTAVIENVKALPTAKKGIEYLKEIGFDTSELEEQDNKTTALVAPVNTAYLFIGGEGDS